MTPPPKKIGSHYASLWPNYGSFSHLVEVLWPFKDFVVCCSVNLAVFSGNLKTDGVTWKVIEKL